MTAIYKDNTDIHDYIKTLKDDSINLIYTSPPYGTTDAKWDKPLRWKEIFKEMWRVLKNDGIIVLHASMPFTYELLKYETPKYHYSWEKNNSTNFFKAKKQPLRKTEEVFVYYKKQGTYNPQMIGDKIYKKTSNKNSQYYGERKKYVPKKETQKGQYPTTHLKYPIRRKNDITRCDKMIEFFIKTYSNEGDLVLDLTTCNKIVGTITTKLKRNFIGCEIRKII